MQESIYELKMTPFPQLIISVNSSSYHHHLINNAKKALVMMMIIIIIIMASDAQLVSEKNNIDRLGIRQVYLYSTISFIASTNPFRVTNFSH